MFVGQVNQQYHHISVVKMSLISYIFNKIPKINSHGNHCLDSVFYSKI